MCSGSLRPCLLLLTAELGSVEQRRRAATSRCFTGASGTAAEVYRCEPKAKRVENDTDASLRHPWLRINRVLRVMLHASQALPADREQFVREHRPQAG